MAKRPEHARLALIAAGALGLAAALWSALRPGDFAPLGRGAAVIARVDGAEVLRSDYELAVEALTLDKRNPLTQEDRARALERLIDEALLVRRGIDMGLAETDPAARKAIVQAMLQFAIASAAARTPAPGELDAFVRARPDLLRGQDSVRVRIAALDDGDGAGAARFRAAIAAGGGFNEAVAAANARIEPTPDALIPLDRLAGVAGPSVRDAAAQLSAGDVAGPLRTGGRVVFIHVIERRPAPSLDAPAARAAAEAAWRREVEAEAVDAQIAALRRRAAIVRAPDAPS